MTKREFTERLADKLGVSVNQASVILEGLSAVMTEVLTDGDEVKFPGLGKLYLHYRKGQYKVKFEQFCSMDANLIE
jgi:nucleoid DNA-binding protein